jgi:hypothetical protein
VSGTSGFGVPDYVVTISGHGGQRHVILLTEPVDTGPAQVAVEIGCTGD